MQARDSGHSQKAVKVPGLVDKVLMARTGYGPLLRDYVYFLLAKLAFHRQHPEFNGPSSLFSVPVTEAEKSRRSL